ncbi:MAG: PadR family transcriptional regulator [Candidatus Bathyarchaeota archaeon]|nr:PadR family transcriptional regulator [Candidatus Bathyarchaeota archaeon]
MEKAAMVVTIEKSEAKIIKKMNERIIKNFLDIIILSELRNGTFSGYDIISYIHNKFQLLVSSGTIYSLLYSLERNGLIEGVWDERKRTYQLTKKGTHTINTILNVNQDIKTFVSNFLKIQ